MSQPNISAANAEFWDELCGSTRAKLLGVSDSSPASLKKFDDWYFKYYPYLFDHIPFAELRGRDVLEIGLGYGTVSQKLAESGARYQGLDIAAGPVAMANHRLRQAGLPGLAVQGSILAPPFAPESFDVVVTIGCLHHTGDIPAAIARCRALLRPGGYLIVMLYYAYSYKRWLKEPLTTLDYFRRERAGYRGVVAHHSTAARADFDVNLAGQAAPHTDWISVTSLRDMCHDFTSFDATLENLYLGPIPEGVRRALLTSPLARYSGLDIYATAVK